MHRVLGEGPFKRIVARGAILLAIPVPLLWAWNVALSELFGAPAMDYRNALGIVILCIMLAIPFRLKGRWNHRRRRTASIRESHIESDQ